MVRKVNISRHKVEAKAAKCDVSRPYGPRALCAATEAGAMPAARCRHQCQPLRTGKATKATLWDRSPTARSAPRRLRRSSIMYGKTLSVSRPVYARLSDGRC